MKKNIYVSYLLSLYEAKVGNLVTAEPKTAIKLSKTHFLR